MNAVVTPQTVPMKITPLIILTLIVLGCAERKSSIPVLPETVVGAELNSQEPRFVFVAPDGFDWNDEHRIWHNKSTRTSITLAHAPGSSFQSVVNEFVSDRMLKSGMELTNKETRDVDGRPFDPLGRADTAPLMIDYQMKLASQIAFHRFKDALG